MALRAVVLDAEVILYVTGVLGGGQAPAFHETVEEAIDEGVRSVVVDLTPATAVDGSGVAVLAATAATCKRLSGRMTIALPHRGQTEITDPSDVLELLRSIDPWRQAG
jgi:anti-anti-sigma factor